MSAETFLRRHAMWSVSPRHLQAPSRPSGSGWTMTTEARRLSSTRDAAGLCICSADILQSAVRTMNSLFMSSGFRMCLRGTSYSRMQRCFACIGLKNIFRYIRVPASAAAGSTSRSADRRTGHRQRGLALQYSTFLTEALSGR